MTNALTDSIILNAKEAGFDAVGFTGVGMPARDQDGLRQMVAENRHGDMEWMPDTLERRTSPQGLWGDVKSVITLGMNYGPKIDPMIKNDFPTKANISAYAQNKDYHDLVKKRLKQIARWLVTETGCELKVFVDTAPVMEKALAARTSIGWQGKHSNVVSREFGSWLFLGEIYTTLDLPIDDVEEDHCGRCTSCIDACPTQAIIAPYKVDARRCISYLTIEYHGHIPVEFRKPMGNRIYGCDDCMAVCPWNKFATPTPKGEFTPRDELKAPLLVDFLALSDAEFRTHFSGSPIKRIKREKFLRNVLIALGNSGNTSNVTSDAIKVLLGDPSPLIRAMAVWALSQLMSDELFDQTRAQHAINEGDPDVQQEWAKAAARN